MFASALSLPQANLFKPTLQQSANALQGSSLRQQAASPYFGNAGSQAQRATLQGMHSADAFQPKARQEHERQMVDALGGYDKLNGVNGVKQSSPVWETPADHHNFSVGHTFQAVGAGIKSAMVWGVASAVVALPLAGVLGFAGLLIHPLLPLAATVASIPLFVGAIAGGLKASRVMFKK